MTTTKPSFWNQFWTKLPIVYRGAIIIGIPVIAVLPAIVSWDWSNRAKADANWWIEHTQEVIRESNSLMRVLVDAETGVRGYAITQKTDFLEPYNWAIKEVPECLQELEELTQDNVAQQRQLSIIKRQITLRFELLTQILNAAETSKARQSSQLAQLFVREKAEMDNIRDLVEAFKAEEWKLLEVRQQRLAQISRITNILQWTTIGFGLLGYIAAIKLYYCAERELNVRLKELALINHSLVATNQLARERNQELDQFTYIVSHDLKAPLRAISNLSEWIEEDLADTLESDTKSNLLLLRNRVQRLNSFIDGLLAYSRAGRIKVKPSTVDVNQLLHEIIDSLAPAPGFIINIDDGMPVLQTEKILLQQVFSNLISNAIKHHHQERGIVKISVVERESFYEFSVADNGTGIATENQDKIFEIFQTLTAKDTTENTGIGLSIVKKIIENQGGKIWLESSLGKGSKFFFTWRK